jgi:hypothetical protein
MGEISAIVKQTKETNVKNSNDLKNLKVNLNGVQSKRLRSLSSVV